MKMLQKTLSICTLVGACLVSTACSHDPWAKSEVKKTATFALPAHNYFCGPNHPNLTSTSIPERIDELDSLYAIKQPEIDSIDYHCYQHDRCYLVEEAAFEFAKIRWKGVDGSPTRSKNDHCDMKFAVRVEHLQFQDAECEEIRDQLVDKIRTKWKLQTRDTIEWVADLYPASAAIRLTYHILQTMDYSLWQLQRRLRDRAFCIATNAASSESQVLNGFSWNSMDYETRVYAYSPMLWKRRSF